MLDILDAPVPYIIGMDSGYFQKVEVKHRPNDAIIVDLDRDVIHLGGLDIPRIPNRDAQKLTLALEEAGGSAYIIPNSGIKGCIMKGTEETTLVPNEQRPRYAYMTTMTSLEADSLGRTEVFSNADLAYGGSNDQLQKIRGFGSVHGQLTSTEDETKVDRKKKAKLFGVKPMKKPVFIRDKKAEILSNSNSAKCQTHLLDMAQPEKFSVEGIRQAFLRFQVATFHDYEDFLLPTANRGLFDEKKFIQDLQLDSRTLEFLRNVVQTQLFQRFLEERKDNPETPEIRFFDESIM
jgi:hypothetical protein